MRLDHLLSKENNLKGFTVYFSMYFNILHLIISSLKMVIRSKFIEK